MTDHSAHDVADNERRLARDWAEHIINTPDTSLPMEAAAARVLLAVLPKRPTLADMTPKERAACQWMQADVANHSVRYVIATPYDEDGDAGMVAPYGDICWLSPDLVTPRPDLPLMEWPGNKKPAPALPDGWRLADHPDLGRIIVTTTPDRYGNVYYVLPSADPLGFDWLFCPSSELTYIDQEAADAID